MSVGVIITVYNLDRFVAEAIKSVLNQTLKPDRIVVVNDGSTDGSLRVIKEFETEVEIINHGDNQGVLPSIIEAIQLFDTEVIAFLDGDDRWDSDKLRQIMHVYETDSACMLVTHSYRRMDATGQIELVQDKTLTNLARIEKLSASVEKTDKELKNSILSYKGVWLGSAFSIRRRCLDVLDFENWSRSIWGHELSHQDQPLAAYLIFHNPTKTIRYLKTKLFDYRVFGNNSSGVSSTREKAIRTINRSKATLLRTYQIVQRMQDRDQELAVQANKLREIEYLELLYTGHWSRAAKMFFSLSFSLWNFKESTKEMMRLCGVLFLGVDRILKYK